MPKYLEQEVINTVHQLYLSGMKLEDIAEALGSNKSHVSTIISRQRRVDPDKWPMRHKKEIDKLRELPLKEARINRICVLEDCDFLWDEPQLKEIQKMWEMELSINYMSEYFNGRDPDEIVLAILHLARNNKIERRNGGLFA